MSTHLGIERMEGATWAPPAFTFTRPRLSRPAFVAVVGRMVVVMLALVVLFCAAEWGRPAPGPRQKLRIHFTTQTLDGRPVSRDERMARALDEQL